MFFPIPMQMADETRGSVPVANTVLIAINVLAYLLLTPANWMVGPGTGLLSLMSYGFVHAGWTHLLFNMWFLWVFGNAVNRRIGNTNYVWAYLGAILVIGILARLLSPGYLLGSSGGVFAVLAIAMLLLPAVRVEVHYLALFPLTLLIGLFRRPKYGLFWFVRWGTANLQALVLIVLFVALELFGFLWWGLNWTNLGHLLGFVYGVAVVLLLPGRVTMGRRTGLL